MIGMWAWSTLLGYAVGVSVTGGLADVDGDPATPYAQWPPGYTTDGGELSCSACTQGTTDHGFDPATACTACLLGTYAPTGAATCAYAVRPSGQVDFDSDSSTLCGMCLIGGYSAIGQIVCTACQPCQVDGSPSTPCTPVKTSFSSNLYYLP